MINSTLFSRNIKSNYKFIFLIMAVLALYFSIIAGMYDPNGANLVGLFSEMKLSPELLRAMGFTLTDSSLVGFLSSYYYGLLMLAFPMICSIVLANRLLASQVEKGSMAYLLSTPMTRKKIAMSQASFLIFSLFLLIGFVTIFGLIFCQIKFPGLLHKKSFIMLNLGVFLLHFALSGISFFASCLFNESKLSLLFGAGISIGFLLIQMVCNTGKSLDFLRYFTIMTLFQPGDIIKNQTILLPFLALLSIGTALYCGGIYTFNTKDLPL